MKILFLDDDPIRHRAIKKQIKNVQQQDVQLVQAFDLTQFQSHLNDSFDIIFLDHDLRDEVGTKAVEPLFEMDYNRKTFFIIHSNNPVGAKNILTKLKSAGFERAIWYPFGVNATWLDSCIYEWEKKEGESK